MVDPTFGGSGISLGWFARNVPSLRDEYKEKYTLNYGVFFGMKNKKDFCLRNTFGHLVLVPKASQVYRKNVKEEVRPRRSRTKKHHTKSQTIRACAMPSASGNSRMLFFYKPVTPSG